MELKEEEICQVVKKMKKGKAAGIDGIPMEAWLYGSHTIREGFIDLVKQIWREDALPKEWRSNVVVPLYKKGDTEETENYRWISLLCSAYKILAEVLKKKLEGEVEEKELLPKSQAGFRRERGTIDNIFVVNHIVQRDAEENNKKIYAFFMEQPLITWQEISCGGYWSHME